jgi:hypothetical protein
LRRNTANTRYAHAETFAAIGGRRSGKKPDHKVQEDGAEEVYPRGHDQHYQAEKSSREKLLLGPDDKRDSFRPLQHSGALPAWWSQKPAMDFDRLGPRTSGALCSTNVGRMDALNKAADCTDKDYLPLKFKPTPE